jgi:hypothetical protein
MAGIAAWVGGLDVARRPARPIAGSTRCPLGRSIAALRCAAILRVFREDVRDRAACLEKLRGDGRERARILVSRVAVREPEAKVRWGQREDVAMCREDVSVCRQVLSVFVECLSAFRESLSVFTDDAVT